MNEQRALELIKELEEKGFTAQDLDADVHEACAALASRTNNQGLGAQVRFLLEHGMEPAVLQDTE